MLRTTTDDDDDDDDDVILLLARSAKERKVRIWKDYVAPTANLDQKDRQFVAKVSSWSDFYKLCPIGGGVSNWHFFCGP